jgi:hypothetical protein
MQNGKTRGNFGILKTAIGITSVLVLALGIVDLWTGPHEDRFYSIIDDDNPINWLTTLNLWIAGVFAGKAAFGYWRGTQVPDWTMRRLVLAAMSAAFFLGGLDETFELHERLGGIMKTWRLEAGMESVPRHFFKGNVILAVYALAACGAFYILAPALRESRFAYRSFAAAIGFQVTALVCERFLEEADRLPKPWVFIVYLEEISELYGTLFFALSMIFLFRRGSGEPDRF